MFNNNVQYKKEKEALLNLNNAIDLSLQNDKTSTAVLGSTLFATAFGGLLYAGTVLNLPELQYASLLAVCGAGYCASHINTYGKVTVNETTMYNSFKNKGVITNDNYRKEVVDVLNQYKSSYEKIVTDVQSGKINKKESQLKKNRLINTYASQLNYYEQKDRIM
ncbi:MAG: hypothetical protein IJZ29_00680 [Clostridia bacterium]|nr:hypothetical protein [Clostridia bacterium]